jgi:ppGpp synthetase/RelA/SpoT-type nucleotidyltranferase
MNMYSRISTALYAPAAENGNDAILHQYDESVELYDAVTRSAVERINELLTDADLKVHSVSSRIKTQNSLHHKLHAAEPLYKTLSDVTDIGGIRIITYFEDEIDEVVSLIKKEFTTDDKNSIDKRNLLAADRFGYLSAHYVIVLNAGHITGEQHRDTHSVKLEVQVRSILQHVWAEIEHDLCYKNSTPLPQEIKRRMYRLAGVLELADKEFSAVKYDLNRLNFGFLNTMVSRIQALLNRIG